jgi:hypothetical protein
MDLAKKSNAIVLRLIKNDVAVEIPVNLGNMANTARIPVTVEFFIWQGTLEAKLSLGEGRSLHSLSGSVNLYDSLTGEARINLGGNYKYSDAAYSPEVQALAESTVYEPGTISTTVIQKETEEESAGGKNRISVVTIWGEFAVMHAIAPFIRETAVTAKTDQTRPAANSAQTVPAETRVMRIETRTERQQAVPVPKETGTDIPVLVPEKTDADNNQNEHDIDQIQQDIDIEENPMHEDDLDNEDTDE